MKFRSAALAGLFGLLSTGGGGPRAVQAQGVCLMLYQMAGR